MQESHKYHTVHRSFHPPLPTRVEHKEEERDELHPLIVQSRVRTTTAMSAVGVTGESLLHFSFPTPPSVSSDVRYLCVFAWHSHAPFLLFLGISGYLSVVRRYVCCLTRQPATKLLATQTLLRQRTGKRWKVIQLAGRNQHQDTWFHPMCLVVEQELSHLTADTGLVTQGLALVLGAIRESPCGAGCAVTTPYPLFARTIRNSAMRWVASLVVRRTAYSRPYGSDTTSGLLASTMKPRNDGEVTPAAPILFLRRPNVSLLTICNFEFKLEEYISQGEPPVQTSSWRKS